MGYAGKLRLKEEAIKLRKKGFSYSEIKKEMDVSKSTLSLWCRDVAISEDQALRLYKRKLKGAERGRIIGAKKQQKMRIEKTKQLVNQGIGEVENMTKRERFYAGIGLYLGDGAKGDKCVDFSNTNPEIIRFMMRWFRDFCNISESRFRGAIWIHDDLDVGTAKKFWSKLTGIPENQFSKTYIAKLKKNSNKIRKKHHKYGVFKIRICSVNLQRKIRGWMAGILGAEEVK